MKRGVTLVELLLACAVAVIGITTVLLLAADVISASARVRQNNAANAPARVALLRLHTDISAAETFSSSANKIVTTLAGSSSHWSIATFGATPYLTHNNSSGTPSLQNSVAAYVHALQLARGERAVTLALTFGEGAHRQRIEDVIRTWGQTL